MAKGAIQVSEHEDGQVISPIFLRYKKDGSPRPIINLKNLNSHIVYSHFKIETLKHALDLISEGCWLASFDIKDAYFHVKIDKSFGNTLSFPERVPCIALLVYVWFGECATNSHKVV